MASVLVNGVAGTTVDVADRGLAYGDGLFETLLVADGEPVWWSRHLHRLQRGCEALGIAMPDAALLRAEAARLVAGATHAVLKLVLTRGAGGRGYAPGQDVPPTRILSLHPAPDAGRAALDGIAVRWCALQLARQPRLAGLKHLNRLEQVLARSEWNDPSVFEGLLCDSQGDLVSATAANVFVVRGGQLLTPPVAQCGIAGTCRAWLLDRASARVTTLRRDEVEQADELFICNSVRGILPVARLDGRSLDVGPMTRRWQEALWNEIPALRPATDGAA